MKPQKQKKAHIRPETKKPAATLILKNKRVIYIWIFSVVVALIIFLIYLPALKNGFVNWDDNEYVYENSNIQSLDFRFLKWFLTGTAFLWHPLTMASYAFDYAIWGLDPWGYHLTNNIFHGLNVFLVFIFAVKVVKQSSTSEARLEKALITGIITSLLFGIHPLHVESVAWISERKDVLNAFFYLLSLLFYLSYASAISSRKKLSYGACLAFFLLALMSKPMAVSLPLVLLILDFYPLDRLTGITIKTMLIEKLPFLLLSLLVSLATLWAHHSSGGLPSAEVFPLVGRIFVALHTYVFYLFKMILPLGLAPLYPYPVGIDFFGVQYLGSFIAMGIITFICIWLLKRNKLFLAVWLYYIITLIPVIGIIKVGSQAAADRYTYLPSLGLFFLMGLGAANICEKSRQYRIAIIAASMLVFGILANITWQQIAVWHNSISLWSHQINLFPQDATGYSKRGYFYYESGDVQRAMTDYNKAIEVDPQSLYAYINRGLAYDKLGNYRQAMQDYSKAIEIDPRNAEAYYTRGGTQFSYGQYQQAIRDYSKAIELKPYYTKAYYNRGAAYNAIEDYRLAVADFTKGIDLDPGDARFYGNRGNAYNGMGDYEAAIRDFSIAISLNPQDALAYYNLGVVHSQTGNIEQAIVHYKNAAAMGLKEAQDMLANITKKSTH